MSNYKSFPYGIFLYFVAIGGWIKRLSVSVLGNMGVIVGRDNRSYSFETGVRILDG